MTNFICKCTEVFKKYVLYTDAEYIFQATDAEYIFQAFSYKIAKYVYFSIAFVQLLYFILTETVPFLVYVVVTFFLFLFLSSLIYLTIVYRNNLFTYNSYLLYFVFVIMYHIFNSRSSLFKITSICCG